jgi:hypothetical protein
MVQNNSTQMRNLIFLLLIFAVSCKPLQPVTVYRDVVKVDTVRDYKVITKFNAVHDTLTIDNPCDSSGILTSFYSRIRIPQGKVIVRSVQGKIQATVDIDSIESVYRDKYKSQVATNTYKSDKVIRTNEIPKWSVWFMAISGVLSFLYIREKVSIFVK